MECDDGRQVAGGVVGPLSKWVPDQIFVLDVVRTGGVLVLDHLLGLASGRVVDPLEGLLGEARRRADTRRALP